ncbi:MAG: T9SS type A sorting domain-containing protein [Bacteroidota bacterium]|nr:T9SS type A sorting domain-containing protein [Bacteroidota bacterium]
MKKLSLTISILCMFTIFSSAQVNFNAENYPQIGDMFPMISYFTNPGDDTVYVDDFGTDAMTFNDISMFNDYIIDTIYFHNPEDYDTNGDFPNATHMMLDGNKKIFIAKNDNHAQAIGFSGDMFDMGMEFPIPVDNPLTLMEFPTTDHTSFNSETDGEYAMPTQALQTVLPPDTYESFAENFDSVKIVISIEEIHNVLETQTVNADIGSANNENLTCLKEFVENYQMIDIDVHVISLNIWMPLADVPGVGDQLPMDLPMLDTTYTLNWWTPEYNTPLVQAETNQNHTIITNLKFHYNGENSIKPLGLESIEVYPNPATNLVKLSDLPNSGTSLIIINTQGKIEKRFSLNGNNITFACDQFAHGWYMLQILDQNEKPIAQQKLIVQ